MSKSVWTEDGRSGEKRTKEVVGEDGHKAIYEELWVEPKPPEKRLAKRQIKHVRPVVHTIETELIDEDTQEVLDRKVESIDPESNMEVRRHIVSEATLSAQSVEDKDCECWVTRDELKEAIVQAVKAVGDNSSDDYYNVGQEHYSEPEPDEPVISAKSVLDDKYGVELDNPKSAGPAPADGSNGIWTVILASACMVLAGGIVAVLVM